ncbi:MAG: dipeptidase [Candidatus Dormibacteria bacterium]
MPDITDRASVLHARSIVVDTHNDLLMLCARRRPAEQGSYFRNTWLPQLRSGGVRIQVLPVFIDDDFRPEGALRQTLRMLETGWQIAASNPDAVRICLTGSDIDAALASGRIALILALEGCEAVGTDVALFEPLHRLGVRIASFTHFRRTMLADGSAEDATGSRLTEAGIEAVAICEALGIILDVSHLGATCTDHLLELATRPVIATHSSAFAVRRHHRNLTDARLRAIAFTGGVVGINVLGTFIDEQVPTVARVVDHVEYVATLVGVDHVGLGPDFFQEISDELHGPAAQSMDGGGTVIAYVPGLEGPAGLPLITAELLRRGWSDDNVRKVLGGAFHDLFGRELGVPAAQR